MEGISENARAFDECVWCSNYTLCLAIIQKCSDNPEKYIECYENLFYPIYKNECPYYYIERGEL